MATTKQQQRDNHDGINPKDRNGSVGVGGGDSGSVGGFSLMHALKGGASVASANSNGNGMDHDDSANANANANAHHHADDSTALLLREGLASAQPAKTAAVARRDNSSRGVASVPSSARVAAVANKSSSFASSGNHHGQQQQQQQQHQHNQQQHQHQHQQHHQQRRSANYRGAPKRFSPKHRGGARVSGNGGDAIPSSSSFEGCYSSAVTPGYNDAFALMGGKEGDKKSDKGGGARSTESNDDAQNPIGGDDGAGGGTPSRSKDAKGPPESVATSAAAPPATPPRRAAAIAPDPPSGARRKAPSSDASRAPSPVASAFYSRAARTAATVSPSRRAAAAATGSVGLSAVEPTRRASPLPVRRAKTALQRWSKKGAGGVKAGARHAGGYSDAVSRALGEDRSEKGGRRGGMGVETASSVRNRSPSPARAALIMPSTIVGGVASVESRDNNNDNNDNNLLDVERGSTASTPSFFGMRQMSPGRMKRTWRKRSAAANAASSPAGNLKNSNLPPAPNFKNSNPSGGSFKNSNGSFKNPNVPPRRISASLFKRLPSPGRMGPGSNGTDDGDLPALLPTNLAQTTMSFDVDDSFSRNNAPARLPSPVPEAGPQSIAAATGPGVLASREFSRVAGQSRAANLAAGCVRAGDNLLRKTTDGGGGGNDDADRTAERAARAYRAGAGGMLVAARDLSSSSSSSPRGPMNDLLDEKGEYVPSAPPPSSSEVTRADLLEIVARDPDAGALPLAMSSALLRAGNADFRRGRYEEACREYAAAGACRSLRHVGRRREGGGDNDDGNDNDDDRLDFEDAVLNGRTANNAASALSRRGMYEEARSEYARALQIKQGALETLHGRSSDPRGEIKGGKEVDDSDLVSDIASTFHNIGLLRMNCDEPRKAEKAYKQSLSLRVKKFGLDDLGVSSTLRALGDLYHELGQHDDAFRSYKESLRIWKSHGSQGRSDFRTADHYYNIGLVFYSKGPLAKARTSAAECLRIRRLLCKGKDTEDGKHLLPVAAALYLLGSIASSSGNYDEALSLLEEALDIRREALDSSDHLLVLNVQLAMGTVLCKQNDAEGAMARFSTALRGRTRRLGKDHPAVAEVLQAVGEAYLSTRRHREARRTLEEALRIRRSARSSPKRGRRASEVAETLDCLGAVLFRSGDAAGAAALAEEALDVLRIGVAGRADSLLAGRVLKNAGDYYQDAEAYDIAVEAYGESLRVLTAWHGKEHVFLSEVLNEIGVTRFKNGEYMIAKQSFTEALRLMRLTHNEANKSAIFPTLNHLGHALYKNNELKLAAETYIESFNIQVSIVTGDANDGLREFSTKFNLVNDRLDAAERDEEDLAGLSESLGGIAGILRYLALVLQDQGDFEAALSANKLSLSVRLCQPIKEHPAIALMAETIAMLEYKRNDPASAMGYFNQALQAKKSFQGESTIDVARTANNLANMHFSLGNLDEAMELYQEALEIKRHCLGDDSDEVANTLNNIAHVMVDAGREQEALGAYHNVVKIRQDLHGKSHLSVAATLASMGDVYIKLGELEIAMTYFEQCIRIRKLHRDPCDERVLENLGSIYGKLGQWHKAESTFEEIVELKRAAHGNECMDVARTLDLLAVSYIEQDRHVESIEHLREALRIRKACLDDDDDEILASLNKLAFVYKSLGMNERMVEMREEFEALQERRRRGS